MKQKLLAALGVAVLTASLTACGSDGNDGSATDPAQRDDTLTVWLMNDAQTNWPELVADVNDAFAAKYPKVTVRVQYQHWNDKTKKLDTALGGDKYPDVVELGNTETMTYILNGALAEVDAEDYDHSDTWIKGLKDTCTFEGRLYCVPYYAGARVAIYNQAMLEEATGDAAFPRTESELIRALDQMRDTFGDDPAYSPLYLPGRYWYAATSYVEAFGGHIAEFDEDSGEWHGTLSSPRARKGIAHFAELVKKYNHGDHTKDTEDHANVMANEKAGVLYGNLWEADTVVDAEGSGNPALKGDIKTAAMPGPGGRTLPSFIGGSDLAVIAKSGVQDLASEWIQMFTSEKSQKVLVSKKTLPNNTRLLEPLKKDPATAAVANAVPNAWFTPIAPGWTAIENQGVIEDMLVDIHKGTSVEEATKEADRAIDALINNEV